MSKAHYKDDDLAIDDWGQEYYQGDSLILDDHVDDTEFYDEGDEDFDYAVDDSGEYAYEDDAEDDFGDYAYDDVDDLDGYAYDESDGFMIGFADAAPEYAESFREVLNERYADASEEEIEMALENIFGSMSAAEGFNFGKVLKSIGRGASKLLRDPVVSQIAKTALPIAGGAVGTLIGGPVGTALGGQLGTLAGSAFGPRPRRTAPARRRAVPRPRYIRQPTPRMAPRTAQARPSPAGGSTAAAQLLQLTQNPNVLKSLLSLALGSQGRESVTIGGGTTVPVGSFMTLLKALSKEAAADADQLMRESQDSMAYMKDEAGEFVVDPAVPEARAEALYETLMSAENESFMNEEDFVYDEYDEFDDSEFLDSDDEYDEVIGG